MLPIRHVTNTQDFTRKWMESDLFPLCDELEPRRTPGEELSGRSLYCLFYEPSFITRTSFERAMGLLGGQSYHTEDASQ
ncbi:MAG: aspartate carbamoyltransferase, partial [Chloroflexi bacterium]|nr:aspartate carbamoyltransferase [Chloroflexota bacterium]